VNLAISFAGLRLLPGVGNVARLPPAFRTNRVPGADAQAGSDDAHALLIVAADRQDDLDAELGRLRAALDAAERLGTPLVRVFSFYVPDGRYAEHRDEVLRRMSVMAAEAAARGITLVHENESGIYGDVAERCLDLVESVGSPALRIAFDPANFVQCEVRPVSEAWPLLRDHVAQTMRRALGEQAFHQVRTDEACSAGD